MMLGRGLGVAAAAAILDQISKALVLAFFGEPGCALHRAVVGPFLDLVLTCNPGVSFGLFNRAGVNSLIFSLAALAIILVLVVWLVGCVSARSSTSLIFILPHGIGRHSISPTAPFASEWRQCCLTACCRGARRHKQRGGKIFHHDRS